MPPQRIIGALTEDLSIPEGDARESRAQQPGRGVRSCRTTEGSHEAGAIRATVDVFRAHDSRLLLLQRRQRLSRHVFKVAQLAEKPAFRSGGSRPKTVDNDLEVTQCPGFGR